MNFEGTKKDKVYNKLFQGKPYNGCDVYSRDKFDTVFKMGRSNNIHRRLVQHKACYPFKSEYWLQFLIVVLEPDADTRTKQLEKTLLSERDYLIPTADVEQSTEKEHIKRPREYRIAIDRKALNSAVEKVLNEKYTLWDFLVVFSEDGWRIIPNTKKPNPIDQKIQKDLWKPTARLSTEESINDAVKRGLNTVYKKDTMIPEVLIKGATCWVIDADDDGKWVVHPNQGEIVKVLKNDFKIEKFADSPKQQFTYPKSDVFGSKELAERAVKKLNA